MIDKFQHLINECLKYFRHTIGFELILIIWEASNLFYFIFFVDTVVFQSRWRFGGYYIILNIF